VIIITNAFIDHERNLQNGVHISPGVTLGGRVSIGAGPWIGVGASIIDHNTIGSGSIIGAGSVVVKDIPDGVVAYGVPAKVIRRIELNDW
jgi:acetyltransferase-like isoleucine patch superfamily enzyme